MDQLKLLRRQKAPINKGNHAKKKRQGIEVPCLGLGCMGMSWAYGHADEKSAALAGYRKCSFEI